MAEISNLNAFICVFSTIIISIHGLQCNVPGKIINVAPTPFTDNGRLNLAVVPKMAKYYAKNNITNILISEFNGDGALPLRERKKLVDAWVKHGGSLGLKIIVEVGLQSFVDTLSLARYCSKLNVAAITHFPELVYRAKNIDETVEDLRRISEVAPNICLIYNELLSSNQYASADAVYIAGDPVPTFCGVETTINTYWDIEAVKFMYNNGSKCNKEVWIFDVHYMYPAFIFGLKSVSIGPNIAPKLAIEMEAAADRCDRVAAKAIQIKVNKLVAAFGNLNGGIIDDEDSRPFFANFYATFELISGINVGARYPIDKANSTVYKEIACNLRSLGVRLADPDNQ